MTPKNRGRHPQSLGLRPEPRRSHALERTQSRHPVPFSAVSEISVHAELRQRLRSTGPWASSATMVSPGSSQRGSQALFVRARGAVQHCPKHADFPPPNELIQQPRRGVVHQVLSANDPRVCTVSRGRVRQSSSPVPDHRVALQRAHQHVLESVGPRHVPADV